MHYNAEFWRALGRRCRRMLARAVEPELIEQLKLWVIEFAEQADRAKRNAANDEKTLQHHQRSNQRKKLRCREPSL